MVKSKKKPSRPQLPEGVFGVIDDLTPMYTLDKLHETPWERDRREASERKPEPFKPKKIKRKKKPSRKEMPDHMMPSMSVNQKHFGDELPDVEFDNTVEVAEALLDRMRRKTSTRTQDISHLLMSRILPSFLGLEAAQSYTTAAMRDALDVEVEIDNSVTEAAKQLASLDLVYYFLRRSTLPKEFKKHYLRTLVEESARHTMTAITSRDKEKEGQRRLTDFQAVIARRVNETERQEDLKRQAGGKRTRNPSHQRQQEAPVPFAESVFGIEGRVGPPSHETEPHRPRKRRPGG